MTSNDPNPDFTGTIIRLLISQKKWYKMETQLGYNGTH